jgi:hypothetical protein
VLPERVEYLERLTPWLERFLADLPAPILADLLGLHVSAASRWATYAKRDWSTYLGSG